MNDTSLQVESDAHLNGVDEIQSHANDLTSGNRSSVPVIRSGDSHWRALAKAASWRLGGGVITTMIAWTLSGEASFAAGVGALDVLLKFGCYYVHERIWDRIDFGRARPPWVSHYFIERIKEDDVTELGTEKRARVGRTA